GGNGGGGGGGWGWGGVAELWPPWRGRRCATAMPGAVLRTRISWLGGADPCWHRARSEERNDGGPSQVAACRPNVRADVLHAAGKNENYSLGRGQGSKA